MKLSVAMCTYNGVAYLQEQLESIAAQTRIPDEIVICDDCSTDGSDELIRNLTQSSRFPVRFWVNEQRLGFIKNFEQAITLCRGEIIALSDQDDVWAPNKLEEIEQAFSSPDCGLVFTDAEIVDERLRSIGLRLWELVGFGKAEQKLVQQGRALDLFLPGWTVTGATMAFRARFRSLVLPIPDDLAMIHDGWCALMIAAVAGVKFVRDPLVKYRQHGQQQVGAKEAQVSLERPLRRVSDYDQLIQITVAARERLASQGDGFDCKRALVRLDDWLTHLEARSNLPLKRILRLPSVLRELLTRRYHRFSKGFRSAAKDILSRGAGTASIRRAECYRAGRGARSQEP